MSNNLDRRLAKLESVSRPPEQVFIWRDEGQTVEQTVAGRFPNGVPSNVAVTILSWSEGE